MQRALNRMKLRHLRLVHAIAEHGQLGVAAAALGMTQPAASRALSEAEDLLGERLFERHPKGMEPTIAGEILARRGGFILADLGAASRELIAVEAGRAGSVRVGAVTGAAVGFVVPAIQDLKRHAPSAQIQIEVAPSTDLMDGLIAARFDFILSRVPAGFDPRPLDIVAGRDEHLELLVRADHPIAGCGSLDLQALSGYPWIIQTLGMPIRAAIERAHMEQGVAPPEDVVDSSSLLATMAYLRATQAISPVAREVSDLLLQGGDSGYATVDLRAPIVLSPYHLIQQKGRFLGPIATRLLELVQARILEHEVDRAD